MPGAKVEGRRAMYEREKEASWSPLTGPDLFSFAKLKPGSLVGLSCIEANASPS